MPSPNVDSKAPLKEIPEVELRGTDWHPYSFGHFGDVWKCIWSTSSSDPPVTVAIKVMRVSHFTETATLAKTAQVIRREAHVWAELKDDHVLSLHGITMVFGVLPAFVSSWMEKGSLHDYLKEKITLSTSQKLDMSRQIASGLKYLHERDIVHGNLTPSNILINSNDRLCLADYGLSTILEESLILTFTSYHNHDWASMRWMAPEMIVPPNSDQGELTKPTMPGDIYSHGCIMLQLLCGQVPYFQLVKAMHVMTAILSGRAPFHQFTGVDEAHKQYSLRCLSTDSGARPKAQETVAFIEAELRKLR